MNNTNNNDIPKLIEDVLGNKDGAFEELYSKTFHIAYQTAALLLKNHEDIEDALQSSYMYVAKSLSNLRNPESFENWLRTIVKHECQKCLNANKKNADLFLGLTKFKEPEIRDEISISQEILEKHELRNRFEIILNELPEEYRICMVLFYYEQKTVSEVSQELGIPEGTVKSRLYNGRKKLEKKIKKSSDKNDILYGIGIIPAFVSFISYTANNLTVSPEIQSSVLNAVKETGTAVIAASAVAGAAGTTEAALGTATAAEAAGGIATSAGSTIAGTVAGTASVKIAAIAVATAVATGGAVTVKHVIDTSTTNIATSLTSEVSTEEIATISNINSAIIETTELLTFEEESSKEEENAKSVSADHSQAPNELHSAIESKTPSSTHLIISTTTTTTKKAETTTKYHETTTKKNTTTKQESTTEKTTKQNTTKPSTTQPPETSTTKEHTTEPTTSPENNYELSNGVLSEYSGNDASVSIPSEISGETVKAIGSGAFAGNSEIKTVALPSSVTKIGSEAFADCRNLTTVSLPSSVQSIGIGAFCECSNLKSINLPDSVTTIGDDAFAECSSLTSLTIPSTVTEIGDNAFGGCENLTIKCEEGSAAHQYAVDNSINYDLI